MLLTILWSLYLGAVAGLLLYALNNYLAVFSFRKYRAEALARDRSELAAFQRDPLSWNRLPKLTVQVPLFNERAVAERIIAAAGALEYPRDRLQIQVLDDSTDETSRLADAAIDLLRRKGLEASHVQRRDRVGFKAGALAAGLATATGELLAIFDADFVPPPDFLLRTVPYLLGDPGLACVQGRWGHLNPRASPLTRVQALAIDGHFGVEQAARSWSGWPLNFNGTAGVWRRCAIEDAGGWQAQTLTEDLDLSYRAQLRGWRLRYLFDACAPCEIPPSYRALQRQQFRWAKGSIQTARALLPRILRCRRLRLGAKIQAVLHLTHYLIHPLMLVSVLATPWVLLLAQGALPPALYALACLGFAVGSAAPSILYLESARALGRSLPATLLTLPGLIVLGLGLCLNNARAVAEACLGIRSDFLRTPKQGDRLRQTKSYRLPPNWSVLGEVLMAGYTAWACGLYLQSGYRLVGPYLLLYLAGFLFAAALNLADRSTPPGTLRAWWRRRLSRAFRRLSLARTRSAGQSRPNGRQTVTAEPAWAPDQRTRGGSARVREGVS